MSKSPTTTSDSKDIRVLAKLMADHDLTEIDIQQKDGSRMTLKRHPVTMAPIMPTAMAAAPTSRSAAAQPEVASPASPPPSQVDEEAGLSRINSPMVGTFYVSSSPQAKPFVNVGDRVKPDSTVCIIEAMKVFNEIKAETSGTVVKVLVASGKTVEFGQSLFLIKPD